MARVWCPGCEREVDDPIILSGIDFGNKSFVRCYLCHYEFMWTWYNIKMGDKFWEKSNAIMWIVDHVDKGRGEESTVVKLVLPDDPETFHYMSPPGLFCREMYKRISNGDSS